LLSKDEARRIAADFMSLAGAMDEASSHVRLDLLTAKPPKRSFHLDLREPVIAILVGILIALVAVVLLVHFLP
jgi:hypothetical protein